MNSIERESQECDVSWFMKDPEALNQFSLVNFASTASASNYYASSHLRKIDSRVKMNKLLSFNLKVNRRSLIII